MVKVSGAAADRWVASPDRGHWAVLFFGPNRGLVKHRAKSAVTQFSGGRIDDPFQVSTIDETRWKAEPSVISDEAYSQALVGGDKVIWMTGSSERMTADMEHILAGEARPNPLVIEGGDLPPRSKLRTLFEKAPNAAAIGCYDDDSRSIRSIVQERFRAHGVHAGSDAVETLVSMLGGDRMANLSEIDKVCLYAGQDCELNAETVMVAIGEGRGLSIDELVFALFDGQKRVADRYLDLARDEGVAVVQIVRRLQSHVERLLATRALIDGGESAERAMAKLRPPVFFKFKDRFRRQTAVWSAAHLEKCLEALIELEIECKSTGMPDLALCQRMALSIAGLAQRLGR